MARTTKPPATPFAQIIHLGVAREISHLRALTGLTLREVTARLGWSNHNELARYEHGEPRKTDGKWQDGGTRSISLERYVELIKLYSTVLPKAMMVEHPAAAMVDDKATKELVKLKASATTLFEYLNIVHVLHITEKIPESDPAVRLLQYLYRLGSAARGT